MCCFIGLGWGVSYRCSIVSMVVLNSRVSRVVGSCNVLFVSRLLFWFWLILLIRISFRIIVSRLLSV